jgi:hypothetical protein
MRGEILVLLAKTCKSSNNNTEQCSHLKDRIFLPHDAIFKKHGPTTSRRPREKRLLGGTAHRKSKGDKSKQE